MGLTRESTESNRRVINRPFRGVNAPERIAYLPFIHWARQLKKSRFKIGSRARETTRSVVMPDIAAPGAVERVRASLATHTLFRRGTRNPRVKHVVHDDFRGRDSRRDRSPAPRIWRRVPPFAPFLPRAWASVSAAAGRSAQFSQGDRATSVELRQRQVSTPASRRAISKRTVTASATPGPAVQAAAPAEWKGAKLKPLGYSVLAGLIIWLIPAPAGVTAKAWHLLAVFVGTIVGIITNVSRHTLSPPNLRSRRFASESSLTT